MIDERVEVEPVRVGDIKAGDVLAANCMAPVPRFCLVLGVHLDGYSVELDVLDSPVFEFTTQEPNRAVLHYDALRVVGKVVTS